ncbi:Sodium-dependent phosphate transport protein [Aphelenchoides avenae]|nr:Sodium-dependent phosphate transport protein [Aphelenchus avenae]
MAKVQPVGVDIPKIQETEEEDDANWEISSAVLEGEKAAKWSELSCAQKFQAIAFVVLKLIALFIIVCTFICTLGLLTDAFQLLGGRGIGNAIQGNRFIQNPISASIVGMVITLVLQSSTTLISILIGMIGGGLITVHQAIPILLGAEMGASFINALVSLGQSGDRDEFRRAFAAASMNDMYNLMNYFVFLPTEMAFGVIESISDKMVDPLDGVHASEIKTLNAITDPLIDDIVMVGSVLGF